MYRILTAYLCVALLLAAAGANAQTISSRDTLSRHKDDAFKATQLVAPVILVGSGLAIRLASGSEHQAYCNLDVEIRNKLKQAGASDCFTFDDYIQYIPTVMDLGLGLVGAKAKSGIIDRTIECGLAFAVCGLLSWSIKPLLPTLRPNKVDYRSFPSGHTITTFTAAELVRIEYGWGWGAAAYAIAVTVGCSRIYRDWHWFSDVLAGAGLGILSANVGYWLLEPTKRLLHIPTIRWGDGTQFKVKTTLTPGYDPQSGALLAGVNIRF